MVVKNGEKWACARCIRGHRVSSCQHEDRELQFVAKKGRPISQCAHCRHMRKVSRSAHVRCDCGERPAKCEHLQRPLDGHKGTCCSSHGGRCSCSGRKRKDQSSPNDMSGLDDSQQPCTITPPPRRRRRTTTTSSSSCSSSASLGLEDLDQDSVRTQSTSPQLTPISPDIFDRASQSFMSTRTSESVSSSTSSMVDLHDLATGQELVPPRSQTESPFSTFHSPTIPNPGLQLDMSAIRDFNDVLASPFSTADFSPTHSAPLHSAALSCAFDPASLFLMSSFAGIHDSVDVLTPTTPLTPPDLAASLPSVPAVVGHDNDAILWPHGPGVAISSSSEALGMGRLWGDLDGSAFDWGAGHVPVDLESI